MPPYRSSALVVKELQLHINSINEGGGGASSNEGWNPFLFHLSARLFALLVLTGMLSHNMCPEGESDAEFASAMDLKLQVEYIHTQRV